MEPIVLNLITPGCYSSSIDLSDVRYSIPIQPNQVEYFKFLWKGQLYQSLILPRKFIISPVLRMWGHIYDEYKKKVSASVNLWK